ncbi:zwei Ig domain protein zig-8-like isoform X2 [Panulirus ornatus]|uniref:zwei Ig domain protein zig-8-like isoform X2 n=1 Tax=Panulirus ornatus TaxID=150431 RepID=UPI003A8B72F4
MCTLHFALLLVITTPGWCSWRLAGPAFVDSPANVTVSEGSHAFLPCRVANLGDRSVTWMRRRNLHIITAGLLTYSPDDRYRVLHPVNTDEWTLHIKFAEPGDGGWYECQVNSDPKITRPILLIVKDKNMDDPFFAHELENTDNNTQVHIDGAQERYIQQGSVLSVRCTILHQYNKGPAHVVWYQGATRLDYDAPRGGIALQTEKTPNKTVSRMMLSSVTPRDSGRYSCRPDTGGYAAVSVHVKSGQHQAAVQQSGYNASINATESIQFVFLFCALGHIFVTSQFR